MTTPRNRFILTLLLASAPVVFPSSMQGAGPWTLEHAIRHALTNSPDARIAQRRVAAARAGIEQANSALWPRLQLQSGYTRTDNPMVAFGSILNQRSFSSTLDFNDVPDMDNLNVRGVVTMPLYTGGRVKAGRDAAKANTEMARANAEAVQHVLAFEVTRAFFTVAKTREVIRAADAAVVAFEKHLVVASNRLNTGSALKLDVLDLQVKLAQAREDLARTRNASILSLRALRNLLGIESGDIETDDSAPAAVAPGGNDSSQRPEFVALRQAELAAEAQVRQMKSGYRPRLSAFGGMDYDRGWVTDGDGTSYTAGLLVQWDVWDGRLTRGRVSEAQSDLDAVREEQRKLRLVIDYEVEQARRQLSEAEERLAVTQSAVAQAGESVDLTRARFEQGLALSTQLIDAQTALTSAQVRRAEAESDRRIAVAALRRALGLPQLDRTP